MIRREKYAVRGERERERYEERGEKKEEKKRQIGKNVEIMVFCLASELGYSVLGVCRPWHKKKTQNGDRKISPSVIGHYMNVYES